MRTILGNLLFAIAVAALLPSAVHAGLIGSWSFDSDFTDASAAGNDLATAGTGTISFEAGKVGNAARFDGASFLFRGPSAGGDNLVANHTSFSVGAWFKAEGAGSADRIILGHFFEGNTAAFRAGLTHHNGTQLYGYVEQGAQNASSAVATDGEWHHGAAVFDGASNTLKLYVDGALVSTNATAPGSTGATGAATTEFSVGGRSINENNFVGLIDEAFFDTSVLSDAQISAIVASAEVPEPHALALLASALLVVSVRRRPRR